MIGRIDAGAPAPLGVTLDDRGANVAVFSAHAEAIELCLFDETGATETARVRLPARTGNVFHGHIVDIRPGQRYGLRAYGPYDPLRGHRFNPNKLLADPYALMLDRPFALHPTMFGYRPGDPAGDLSFSDSDSAPFMPKAVVLQPTVADRTLLSPVPWAETIIYELHVRGFTKEHPHVPRPLRGTFAALAQEQVISHLTALGITSVEIMPSAAWIDERHLQNVGLTNYWGYNPVALITPDPRLAPGGWNEIRETVAALHGAGIEVILDVVFNHTGEGDEFGPTVSFRGLDNATYYRLPPGNPRGYINDTGCGNVLALDRAQVAALAIEAMCKWTAYADIDGFRFDLAATLARGEGGFDQGPSFIDVITRHPILGRRKLIAEPWDVGPGGYRIGRFPESWGEWNDRFRDTARRFWRGDPGVIGELATRMSGSSDLFGARRPRCSINFVTSHDGFTLADLVTYATKRNAANGEGNRDGTDANHSWNNGREGPTSDAAIQAARQRDQRNLLATLFLARGTPMLAMGSELGHSQDGNNNAYAQDNPTAWLDWAGADETLRSFCEGLIALRKAHPALRQDAFLKGEPVDSTNILDIEWRTAEGGIMRAHDWADGGRRTLVAALYSSESVTHAADRVVVVMHAGSEPVRVVLPRAQAGRHWRLCLDTARDGRERLAVHDGSGGDVECDARSIVVLDEADDPAQSRRRADVSSDLLDRLASAAGISAEWFDIAGSRHVVSDATKQALLRAFGLDAGANAQVRDSLARLSETTERRLLPANRVVRGAEPVRLRYVRGGNRRPSGGLVIRYESGEAQSIPVGLRELPTEVQIGLDGRPIESAWIDLPPQPVGRHIVMVEDRPELACQITVAPPRCYMPETFAAGHRAYGLAAQLYSLSSGHEQGIGDFSTLGNLANLAAGLGAATVGLNPLHALFAQDRSRVSPYFPSDRRFRDPVYIDLTALDRIAPGLRPDVALSVDADRFAALMARPDVDYVGVWAAKRRALEESFAAFTRLRAQRPDAPAIRDFQAFVAQGGATLRRYAAFEAISELRPGEPWSQWPQALARCEDGAIETVATQHAARFDFHLFLQWLCERQFAAAAQQAKDDGMALGFYLDLAVGAAPDGAESWMNADQLLSGVSIGAPPDPFAEGGQNWGVQAPNPLAWSRSGYAAFRELIAANMRHAGALRIDHVMGLARLFVIPDGATASDGAYLSYPCDDLLGELALESVRSGCLVVGEALGTVPPGFRTKMTDASILSYRVLWFERDGPSFNAPSVYETKAVACVSTHDLPTLRGWWDGEDIREKEALGLLSAAHAVEARRARARDKQAMIEALQAANLLAPIANAEIRFDTALAAAIHAFVGASSSLLAIAQIDDLAGALHAVNLPGTDRERANWRRKLPARIGEIFSADAVTIVSGLSARRN